MDGITASNIQETKSEDTKDQEISDKFHPVPNQFFESTFQQPHFRNSDSKFGNLPSKAANNLKELRLKSSKVIHSIKQPKLRTQPIKNKISQVQIQSSKKFDKLEKATSLFELNRTDNIYDHKKLLDLIDKGVFHEKFVKFTLDQIPQKKQFILNDLVQKMTEKNIQNFEEN